MSPRIDFLRRRAGLLAPLSSLRSERDCGVGDLGALGPLFDWMRDGGLSVLQLLPVHDLEPDGSCAYSSLSAFALDPCFVALDDVPEIRDSPELFSQLRAWRSSPEGMALRRSRRVRFGPARALKTRYLELAYREFSLRRDPSRERAFEEFRDRSRDWLPDYSLYRAIRSARPERSWLLWPEPLRMREPAGLSAFASEHAEKIRFFEYAQWIAHSQWMAARSLAAARGILLFGDIPFGLSADSADVWSRSSEFNLTASMGAPPDQFSEDGQEWGLAAYRWPLMEEGGLQWWRRRLRRAAELYDMLRLDHVIGFFRTWVIAAGERGRFDVPDEGQARARGERFLRAVLEECGSAAVVAEDLGVIPPWARETLAALGIPGYKVARWEKRNDGYWHPRDYPALSVANLSNHDTSPLARWWREMKELERSRYWEMVLARRETPPAFSPEVQERLLANLFEAGSALAVLPFQDCVGSTIKINTPGTMGFRNWTYRIPWTVESLSSAPRPARAAAMLRRLAAASGRLAAAVERTEQNLLS